MSTPDKALAEGLALQARGELAGAEARYRRALALAPDHPAATHALGLVATQRGRLAEAIPLLRKSVTLDSANASFHANLGAALIAAGHMEDAARSCRQAVALKPDLAAAQQNLGRALNALGQLPDALAAYRQALALRPDEAALHVDLGEVLRRLGKVAEAEAMFRKALAIDPGNVGAHHGLARALRDQGRVAEEIALFGDLARRRPEDWTVHGGLGNALLAADRVADAETAYRRAVALAPSRASAHNSLGAVLTALDRNQEAVDAYGQAIAIDPDRAKFHSNLAVALHHLGRLDEADESARRALALNPEHGSAHHTLGMVLMLRGDVEGGLPELEWRLDSRQASPRAAGVPRWSGKAVAGRDVLVWAEMGIGDQVMFASLLGDLIARGARPVVELDPRLEPLLLRSFPGIRFARPGDQPKIDLQVAVASLARWLRPSRAEFARPRDPLRADATKSAALRARYQAHYPGRRLVGISWRGGKTRRLIEARSIGLDRWAPILRSPQLGFVSLQYGDCAAEIAQAQLRMGVEILHDPGVDPLASIDDLAAQVAAMDLVISVDNSTVHVAGALGVPVWALLPWLPDWRWGTAGGTSYWYASARLFRRAQHGQWDSVIEAVCGQLAAWAAERPVAKSASASALGVSG
jgi:Flp pilus assembly protein TadD